jgi:acetyl esterase/lipase
MAEGLALAGWTVATPEYRRVPGSPDLTCTDVRVALRVLPVELRGRFDGRVVVLGHSAGGHLALWAAAVAPAPGLHATIALAPVADLLAADRERLGSGAVGDFLGAPAASRPDLDPTRMAAPTTVVTILHGVEDQIVPLRQSQAYSDGHPSLAHPSLTHPALLRPLPGAAHFDLIDPLSPHWTSVLAALTEASSP